MEYSEIIIECLMVAFSEIKDDLPDFMRNEDMYKYLESSWKAKIDELVRNAAGKKISKDAWRPVLDFVKKTIPLRHDADPMKVSLKFGSKFIEVLNKQGKK